MRRDKKEETHKVQNSWYGSDHIYGWKNATRDMWYKEWSFEWRTNKWSFQWTNDRNGWKSQSHEWKLLGLQPQPAAKVTWTWELRTSRNRPGIMYWWCRETNETVQGLTLADRNPLSLSLTPMTTWQRLGIII